MSKVSKILQVSNLNQNIVKARYAVRGPVVQKADQLNGMLASGQKLPFDEIVFCNIGNPQQLAQKPITFNRNVLALVSAPHLLKHEKTLVNDLQIKRDVISRAREILSGIDSGSTGAYTHSQGLLSVRNNVAQFIAQRDTQQEAVRPERIFLTDGASPGVQMGLSSLIRDESDGIMIPIPQYPLYSASIQLCGGTQVGYYLDEEAGWGMDVPELEKQLSDAKKKGINVRALVVINPGNPTGQVLAKDSMKGIVEFCHKNRIVLLADEVYQENIYGTRPFHSFNSVVNELGLAENFEMISYHSTSKGFLGECGRRGGYFQLSKAIDNGVHDEMYKVASVNLCPNVDGQIMVDLMVAPPKKGEDSHEEYINERDAILGSLKRRAVALVKKLNSLEGVSCQQAEGAMYAFPQITIPAKAVAEAQQQGVAPDMLYVLQLLEQTGVCVIPGSGFGQKDGTYHFRTTFLPAEDKIESVCERIEKFHNNFMQKYA